MTPEQAQAFADAYGDQGGGQDSRLPATSFAGRTDRDWLHIGTAATLGDSRRATVGQVVHTGKSRCGVLGAVRPVVNSTG